VVVAILVVVSCGSLAAARERVSMCALFALFDPSRYRRCEHTFVTRSLEIVTALSYQPVKRL